MLARHELVTLQVNHCSKCDVFNKFYYCLILYRSSGFMYRLKSKVKLLSGGPAKFMKDKEQNETVKSNLVPVEA